MADERKHGHWKKWGHSYTCSECGHVPWSPTPFCQRCGTIMDEPIEWWCPPLPEFEPLLWGECPECGERFNALDKEFYCPNCGVKLKVKDEVEDDNENT